jgi:hypothetical protein
MDRITRNQFKISINALIIMGKALPLTSIYSDTFIGTDDMDSP